MKEQEKLPKIAVFATGGTIQCTKDAISGKVTPAMTGTQMLSGLRGLNEHFEIEVFEPFTMPGSDLTLREGLILVREIRNVQKRDDIDGIVVLQGTDTMDEIPYFLHVALHCEKPVVFTGSMKSSHDFYSDALGNVYGAALVASDPKSWGRGVLVFFNETVFSALEVNKYHAYRIDAFRSNYGPLGGVIDDSVYYYRDSKQGTVFPVENVDINVPILKCYAGIDNQLLVSLLNTDAKAVVIEGYGTGNIPWYMSDTVKHAVERGIPIIIATRCVDGESYACYDYVGGGAQLEEFGAILSGELNAIKSRIKVIAMLSCGKNMEEIREEFAQSAKFHH